MNMKKKEGEFVKISAYVPKETWDKATSYMIHTALTTGDGKPHVSTYGAISNTVSSALDSYCNIVYNYSVMNNTTDEKEDEEDV